MYVNNEKDKKKMLQKNISMEKEASNKDNNNKDPYGYDFVPTIAHWTNIDEQKKEVNKLENIGKDNNVE